MERLAERYELSGALGQGRSTVYRALDTRLRRQVAIKRVELLAGHEEVEQVRTRALREAQAAARLNNPCVVTVYDVIEESGAIWLVMELVGGPSLAQIVADQGPLPHRRAAAIALGVLTALEAAHLVGVVHRDVKPANVLVPEGDRAKLTDFGVATIRDESRVTATGLIVGSPSYMAPEQATGGEITAATDMWALGALLYFAVEGEPPFQAGNALATATAVAHDDPRPPQHPGPLSPVIARLLTKAPAHRATAGEVRAALTRVARGVRRRAAPAAPATPAAAPAESGAPATPGMSATPAPAPAAPVPSSVPHPPIEPAAAARPASGPPLSPVRTSSSAAAAPPGSPDAEAAGEPASPRASEVVPAAASGHDTAVHGPPPAAGAPPPPGTEPLPTARRRVPPALVAVVGLVLAVAAAVAVPALQDGGDGSGDDGEAAATTDPPGAADEPATPGTTAPSTTEAPTTTATSGAGLPAGWAPFADPAGTYTIGLPPGWQVRPTGADNRIDLVDPATESFLRVEWTASPSADAAQAWRELAASFATRNDNYQEIGIGPAEYRDYDAALWEFRHGSDPVLHTGNLGFVTAGRGYALMLRTSEDLWDESQVLFDQFKQAFQPT
jgi:tRNA A-37 threonylcarbamoyl transferase component Bud32